MRDMMCAQAMPTQPQCSSTGVPIRFGTGEQFKTVREFLVASGFTRQSVRERVTADLPEADAARAADWGRTPSTAVDLLTWVFVLGQTSPSEQVHQFPQDAVQAMEDIGLLARDPGGHYFSPVFLVPVEGLYFAADRWFNPDGSAIAMCPDVVYPASAPTTLRFLNLLPKTRCERLLDLGCGSGVLALTAAYAGCVWATDITERSCAFTEFNRRLNGVGTAQVLQGDLYEPVANQAFDRIVAHPPYMPVLKPNCTFSDGGKDGERFTRKIVAGLPTYLSSGGLFLCDATGSDRDLPFELRVREWLGERHSEFDVAVLVRRTHEPHHFAGLMAGRYPSMGPVADWVQSFESQQIRRILQMTLCVQRLANPRPAFTTRRSFAQKESATAITWLLQYETHAAAADNLEWVMRERPSLPPWLTMQITSRPGEQGFTPVECRVTTDYPFLSENIIEPWMVSLLNLCNGQRTTAELFQIVLQNGYVPADSPPEQFAAFISAFAAKGLVELQSFRLPPPE